MRLVNFYRIFTLALLLIALGAHGIANAQTQISSISSISWQSHIGNAYYSRSKIGERNSEYFQLQASRSDWSGFSGRVELLAIPESIRSRSVFADYLSANIFPGVCLKVVVDTMLIQDLYPITQTFFAFEISKGEYVICRRA